MKSWVFWADFFDNIGDFDFVCCFITGVCHILEILLKKVTFLTEVKAQWKATIFIEPKEPLSVDLLVHLNPEV